jgi:S23 ribosomal protein.
MKTHKDLDVWNQSMDLVVDVYTLTKKFPKEEIYSLTSQLRRAAISIPSNVSEGAARKNRKEFIQFLYIALGSLAEVETQVFIAQRLNYAHDIDLLIQKVTAIKQMINGLIRYLRGSN